MYRPVVWDGNLGVCENFGKHFFDLQEAGD